ncbi:hypothetical protein DRO56_04675 [Candidatus Bathyarchaeota archaeon]|nr:MAG: hypothetical protein DRO56_04675 [Candidatus Bathyarchaeota archaeon]
MPMRVIIERCDGCGRCVEICPMDVLRLEEGV